MITFGALVSSYERRAEVSGYAENSEGYGLIQHLFDEATNKCLHNKAEIAAFALRKIELRGQSDL